MLRSISILLLMLVATGARADRADLPAMNIPSTTATITIDGDLSDAAWRTAARTTDFTQYIPVDSLKPSVDTRVFATYNEEYLYLGFICDDDPSAIRATLTDRDRMYNDDFVGIILDTYGDGAWAYEFYVNPLGVQGDLRWMTTGEEDSRFDVVYYTDAIVTDSGWQAEIAIPFSSLRFPEVEEQEWRATFWRSHPRDSQRKYSWAPLTIGAPCFFCQFGYLTGIHGVRPGSRLDLLPAIVAYQSGERSDLDNLGSPFDDADPDLQGELNVRYRLADGLTAEATINPDFSQVESDAAQIQVNTTYALSYPERRPFFQQGSDLYDTDIDVIYTRAVNDPEGAGKLTGRFGRTSFFYLGASDENSALFIPGDEGTNFAPLGKTYSNIARIRRTIGEDSHVGALITDRRVDAGDGSNTVYGVDASARLTDRYRVQMQVLGSRTTEIDNPTLSGEWLPDTTFEDSKHTVYLDGETFDGFAAHANIERNDRFWSFDFDLTSYSPTFRADNGRIFRNGIHELNTMNAVTFRPNGKVVTLVRPYLMVGRIWEYSGRVKDGWVRGQLNFDLTGPTYVEIGMLFSHELFRSVWFDDIRRFSASINNYSLDMLRFGVNVEYGNSIARRVEPLPVMGRITEVGAWMQIKPLQQFTIEPDLEYVKIKNRDTDENIDEGYVFRTRLNYQHTRRLAARLIVQYDDFDSQLNLEPLLTYKVNPFTIFYIGSSARYEWQDDDDLGGKMTGRQFFLKLQYLFRA